MNKCLIAYFTHSGNTEAAAKMIQEHTGGTLFQVSPETPYPREYQACVDTAKKELKEDARPAISGEVADMDSYDTIYIAYPNWWGTIPMALFTFLEAYDFADKKIMPLCTHEGSGMGRSEGDIKKLCPKACVGKGLAVRGSQVKESQAAIVRWV